MKKIFTLLTLLLTIVGGVKASIVKATWDFTNSTVVSAVVALSGSSESGTIAAVENNGVLLTVEANGQTIRDNGNSIQTGDNVVFKVPVTSTKDIVTVNGYPGNYAYSIAGINATQATTAYTTKAADVTKGYVEIVNKGQYIISITLSTFKDIRIDLTKWSEGISTGGNPSTVYVSVDNNGTPSYSSSESANSVGTLRGYYHGTTYGWQKMTASIPVPGYVKITYGTNDYGNEVHITNSTNTEVASLNNHSSNKWSSSHPEYVVTTQYTSSEPTTLNFSNCEYVGYFAVEKMTDEEIAALSTNYTLTYYDTNGTELGTQVVAANAAITTFNYSSSDCTIASGYTFRGWFATATGGQKYTTSTIVTGNMSLYAVATETEVASDDKTYTFNLTDQYFYAEDHEAFNPTGGSYHDGQHGWVFSNGNTIDLLVGAKAIISIGICQYSKEGTTIQVKKGNSVLTELDGKAATDGATVSYDYQGEAGTLTLNIESEGSVYIHSVKIENYNGTTFYYTKNGQWYTVNAGSAVGFTQALSAVNVANSSTNAERSFIFLPNGTYDLGTATLTQISGHNISIIGESRDGVVIQNRPTEEGIAVTATLKNTGTNNYLQDLTLDCVAPWSGNAERGVCLQDAGNKTICKNVYLKGLQDSYYANNTSGQYYFEGGKIEGTVDYVCGNGDVYFNNTLFYNAVSKHRGNNGDVIAAPNTLHNFGYIFNNCTIDGEAAQNNAYKLGRPWAASGTKCLWVNTTMNILPATAGWDTWDNHTVAQYAEYKSVNGSGAVVDLSSRLTSIGSPVNDPTLEATEAAALMPDQVSWDGGWTPYTLTTQLDAPTVSVSGTTTSWDAVTGASAYALYKDNVLVGITTETSYTVEGSGTYTLRVANSMGGFGDVTGTTTAVSPAISSAGYATYSCDHALDFSSATGVKAYLATSVTDGKVMMTKVTGTVPANTGLFLQKDGEAAISIPVVPSASAPAANLLKPSVNKTVVAASGSGSYRYVFAKQGGVLGFYKLTSATDLSAGKAYLETTTALSSTNSLAFVFDDATAIEMIANSEEPTANGQYYNLNGQKVAQPTKGLYIVNGKKYVIK